MKRSVVLLSLLAAACTLPYQPVSDWENREYRVAVFDVHPDDVRADLARYPDTEVAWVGLIAAVRIDTEVQPALMHLEIDHKFFSWKIDGTSRQYFLSPRGEGRFATRWPMQPEWDLDQMRALIQEGDMAVVYGVPEDVRSNGTIDMGQARYIRHVPKAGFRTDKIEYGRPGEPGRVISVF